MDPDARNEIRVKPADWPTATATVRTGARGTPVAIAGETWLLVDAVPTLSSVWDAVYDQSMLDGACDMTDLMVAAEMLLLACHDVTLDHAVRLATLADPTDLAAAVAAALFGPVEPIRTWSGWVRSALLANGLRPEAVPPSDLRDVLDHLVATGRAVPAERWITSAGIAREKAAADQIRSQFRAMAKPPQPPPEPAAADPFSFAGPPE